MNIKELLKKAAEGEEITPEELAAVEELDEKVEAEEAEKQVDALAKTFEKFLEKFESKQKENIVETKKIEVKKADEMTNEEIRKGYLEALVKRDVDALKKFVSVGVAGAHVVPTILYDEVMNFLKEETTLMQNAKVIQNCPANLDVAQLTTLPTAYFRGEAAAKTSSTPAFNHQTLTPYSVAVLCGVTNEFLEDAEGMGNMIVDAMNEALVQKMDEVFAAGTGNGQPTGIEEYFATYPAAQKIAVTDYAALADRIVTAPVRLKSRYAAKAKWYMNQETLEAIHVLKDLEGRYLVTDDLTGEYVARIKGKPVVVNDHLTNIWFGDFEGYWIGQRGGIELAESDSATYVDGATTKNAFQDNMRVFRVETRIDGELVNDKALVAIEVADES